MDEFRLGEWFHEALADLDRHARWYDSIDGWFDVRKHEATFRRLVRVPDLLTQGYDHVAQAIDPCMDLATFREALLNGSFPDDIDTSAASHIEFPDDAFSDTYQFMVRWAHPTASPRTYQAIFDDAVHAVQRLNFAERLMQDVDPEHHHAFRHGFRDGVLQTSLAGCLIDTVEMQYGRENVDRVAAYVKGWDATRARLETLERAA